MTKNFKMKYNINLIACLAKNGALGIDNKLLMHIPQDLQHFKRVTSYKTVVMGRKTWESLPIKPLPNRRNIVLSTTLETDKCEVYKTKQEILDTIEGDVFIIGGASIYDLFYEDATSFYLTEIDKEFKADTFFRKDFHEDWNSWQRKSSFHDGILINYKYLTKKK